MRKIIRPPKDFLSEFLASFPRTHDCGRCRCRYTCEFEDIDIAVNGVPILVVGCPNCEVIVSLSVERGTLGAVRAYREELESTGQATLPEPAPPPKQTWWQRWTTT